jgi:hypothetical protein
MEGTYLTIAVMSYFFTDAAPQYGLKKCAAVIITSLLATLVLIMLLYAVDFIRQGPALKLSYR